DAHQGTERIRDAGARDRSGPVTEGVVDLRLVASRGRVELVDAQPQLFIGLRSKDLATQLDHVEVVRGCQTVDVTLGIVLPWLGRPAEAIPSPFAGFNCSAHRSRPASN